MVKTESARCGFSFEKMLKDYIDCDNDATSEFLTDMPEINSMMSEETTTETPEVEHVVTTITVDDIFEIECSSVAEEIIIEDEKAFDSSPTSEVIEVIGNDNVEELQSPISDQVEELITSEHINSKHVLSNKEFDTFLNKILPSNQDISTNGLMEIDTPFLNGTSSQNTNDVEFASQETVQNQNNASLPNATQTSGSDSDPCCKTTATESTDKPYKCHICGKFFSRNSSLKCHIRIHVEGPDSLLRGSSEPSENVKSHFVELSTKKEVVESVVDENATDVVVYDESATTDVLNSSRDSVDLTEDEDKRDYKCIICEKTFSRKSSLTFHYKFHPKSPTSKSPDDITIQNTNGETAMEIDSPATDEQYKCEKCDRMFIQKNTYAWHLKMHETNVRRKSSDIMSAVSQSNGVKDITLDLTDEVNTTKNSPEVANVFDGGHLYKCHLCPRSFPQLRGLKTHSGVHKKRKIDETLNGPETLNQIIYEEVSSRKYPCSSKHHNHDDDDEVTKLYKCNVCYKCFCDIGHLKRHLACNHQEEDTSEGSDEDYVPKSRNKISKASNVSKKSRKHISTRAVDDFKDEKGPITIRGLYKCGVCNESFDEMQLLADHVNIHIQAHQNSLLDVSDDTTNEELCCVVCEKTFRNQNALSRHMNEHRRREEEILVRVTSSGRKIRERRSSEDLTTNSPIKCIPCNRFFETIRAKRIHDASKHPAAQSESDERDSDTDDEVSDNETTNNLVCDCCNRSWKTLRALSIHKSWNRHKQSLAAANELASTSLTVEEPNCLDPVTHTEENKTENDVSSSVKCGCCNELFPNIPALNAHLSGLSGQTHSTTAESVPTSSAYERNDMVSCDSLRDLIKCDRCDKFCASIPALKLHIISDHAKKSVSQNSIDEQSTTTTSVTVPDNVVQTESGSETPGQKDKPIEPNIVESLAGISTQPNDKIVDKSATVTSVTVSQNIRRRKSVVVDDTLVQLPTLLKCDLCDETFTSNRALNSHKSIHVTDSSIDNAEKAKEQTDGRTETTTYVCCDKTFSTAKGLKLHQRHHPSIIALPTVVTPSTSEEPSKLQHAENNIEMNEDSATVTNSSISYPTTDNESEEEISREYKCTICAKVFVKQKFLRYHRAKKHFAPGEMDPEVGIGEFPCPKCPKRFEKETSLRVHKAYHTTKEKNAPIDCGTYTDMRNDTYKCNKCDREFETSRGAIKHYAAIHKFSKEEDEYSCSLCDRSFNCSQGLAGHMWGHKRGLIKETVQSAEEEEDTEDFLCTRCDKSFSNAGNLKKHRRSVHGIDANVAVSEMESETFCELCEKLFVSKSNLNRHRRNVHRIDTAGEDTEGEEPDENEEATVDDNNTQSEYSCADCDRVFATFRGLNGHRQLHQVYPCSECDKTFTSIRNYNAHKETHTEGEFKCDQCDRTFKSARSLGGHKSIHNGKKDEENESDDDEDYQDAENELVDASKESNIEGEFKCDKCDRTFKSARSLGGHKPTHYRNQDDENESDDDEDYHDAENESADDADNEADDQSNDYSCQRCDRSFKNARSLAAHLNSHFAHDNPLELACPQCQRVFPSHRALSAHYLIHRTDEMLHEFPCPKCESPFSNMKSMYEHFCKVHKRKSRSKRSVRNDSKVASSNDAEIVADTKDAKIDAKPALASIVEHPCTKCGQEFASEHSLIDHKRICKTRSRSVGDRASFGDNFEEMTNSNAQISRRRAKSYTRSRESLQPQNYQQPMEVDTQKDCNKNDDEEATKNNMQLSCVINDQLSTTNNTEADPKCDLCSLVFKDLMSLAKHMADSHESKTDNPTAEIIDYRDLPVRVHHCTQCEKIFANRIGLRRHSKTHSEPLPLPWVQPPSNANVQCPSCPRTFFSIVGLRRHSSVHKNGRKSVASASRNTLAEESSVTESKPNQAAIPITDSVAEKHVVSVETSNTVEQSAEPTECLTNGVDESINSADLSLREPINQTVPSHDNAIDRVDDSVNDATVLSNDTQRSRLIDDLADSSQTPAPAVPNEVVADLSCKLCSRRFNHVKKFNKHMQFHKFNDGAVDGEETNVNDSPKQRRSSDGSLMNGTTEVELLAYVKCDICAETFKKAETLRKHAFDAHNVTITSPILYHCNFCDKPFYRGKSLFLHLKSHTSPTNNYSSSSSEEDGMPYECISCEKCFRIKSDLLEHVKTHDVNHVETLPSAEPLVNGSIVEKSSSKLNGNMSDDSVNSENYELKIADDDDDDDDNNDIGDQKNHVDDPVADPIQAVHEPEPEIISKPTFQCSECGKLFEKQRTLSFHSRIHRKKEPELEHELEPATTRSNKKDHKCPLCEMSFNLKTSLAIHVQKHSGVKLLRKALKRSNDGNDLSAEDGVRISKRAPKDIS